MNHTNFFLVIFLCITSSSSFIHIVPLQHESLLYFSHGSTNDEDRNEFGNNSNNSNRKNNPTKKEMKNMMKRIIQLERLVANQSVEISRLRQECQDLKDAAATFAQVVELLRQAGFTNPNTSSLKSSSSDFGVGNGNAEIITTPSESKIGVSESEIFGNAPNSVIDAADAAGSSILAAVLGGKMRMLVDVRDAELTRDSDMLAQFIELAILPVAAGLEGLNSKRNRVKIVFPTVSLLLQYRRSMALAAPEVIALSTLGFDAVEEKDNLVVIIAPSPDDMEGNELMMKLLNPANKKSIEQPVVVLNYHMVPVNNEIISNFEVVYHLRLLSVHYMTGDAYDPEYTNLAADEDLKSENRTANTDSQNAKKKKSKQNSEEDPDLSAAMEHAHEMGFNHGITRAMVIRSYPRPWHVFVDTSPDMDADFEIAAIFDTEPTQDEVNYSIIECLEGSEKEDELVAQQMQKALEAGQLSRVSKMLGISPRIFNETDDEEDDDYSFWRGDEDSC